MSAESPDRVDVSQISQQRLLDWLRDCERDHATPIALVAVGHDEHAGELHVYRTEDGPRDYDVGRLVSAAGAGLMRADRTGYLRSQRTGGPS
jgi:hypothetical protein